MKKNFLRSILILVILLVVLGEVKAQNSVSLSVSCSIPAISGLNAPLLEDSYRQYMQEIKETFGLKIITLYTR